MCAYPTADQAVRDSKHLQGDARTWFFVSQRIGVILFSVDMSVSPTSCGPSLQLRAGQLAALLFSAVLYPLMPFFDVAVCPDDGK